MTQLRWSSLLLLIALSIVQSAPAKATSGWTRIDDGLPNDPSTTSTIQFLLTKLRLDTMPATPLEKDHEAIYAFNGPWPFVPFDAANGTISRSSGFAFQPSADFEKVCTALIDREIGRVLTDDVRKALGIKVRSFPLARSWLLPVAERPIGRYEKPLYLWEITTWDKWVVNDDITLNNVVLTAGMRINPARFPFYGGVGSGKSAWENRILDMFIYRSDRGQCSRHPWWGGMHIRIPITIGARDMKESVQIPAAPTRKENTVAPPAGPDPALRLTRTGPPDPKPAAPKTVKTIVYKPGVRPTPPTPPPSTPCPKGQGPCATQEDGPLTAEGIAYRQQLAAYEAAVKAFEAKEATARQAVAEANKQQQAQHAANQAALDKQRADALVARDAKIAADQAAYNAQLKAYQDESRRRTAEHEAAMTEWRRRTAACLAGDKSQCANDGKK